MSGSVTKARFSVTDVIAILPDLRIKLIGQRLSNIYDLNDKTYLFKFAIAASSAAATVVATERKAQESDEIDIRNDKVFLLIESGIRFHTTKYSRDKADLPSPFTMKLRKYLRTKRLEAITQLGTDRVLDLKFGNGDATNHIILELYSNGNIILTDKDYSILALLRSHQFDEEVSTRAGEVYPIAFSTTLGDASSTAANVLSMQPDSFLQWARAKDEENRLYYVQAQHQSKDGKKVKAKALTARGLLLLKDNGINKYGSEVLEDCLFIAGVGASTRVEDLLKDPEACTVLLDALKDNCEAMLQALLTAGQRGYILCKEGAAGSEDFSEFTPRLSQQHIARGAKFVEFSSFDEAVDEFYCKVEDQKLTRQAQSAEEAAKRRVEKVRQEQEGALRALAEQQARLERAAMLVEMYAEDVDKVCLVLNSCLQNGMSWDDIEAMVEAEVSIGNPIASLVSRLNLKNNRVVLRLNNQEDDVEEDVEIDLSLSAHANARAMYSSKKVTRKKEEKTTIAAERALSSLEERTQKDLEGQKLKRSLQAARKVHWFEKFNWFISSDGHLVLSGRDAQQNEALVKRYLRPGDVYVHADLAGAATCVIRCKVPGAADKPGSPISPLALNEAGAFAVCRSTAWANKVSTSAWWVWWNQVSKTAPSGEFLVTGSFMIYGKKNFLPPSMLEMGFAVLFRVDDASVARHLDDRGKYSREDDAASVVSEAMDRYGLAEGLAAMGVSDGEGDEDSDEEGGGRGDDEEEEAKEDVEVECSVDETAVKSKGGSDKQQQQSKQQSKQLSKQQQQQPPQRSKDDGDTAQEASKKKKFINKKKALRYAEQDEEDREFAMLALGHSTKGDKLKDRERRAADERQKDDLKARKKRAGIDLVSITGRIDDLQSEPVREALQALLLEGRLKEEEIDGSELIALADLPEPDALSALALFAEGISSSKVGNKTSFLNGIIRRLSQRAPAAAAAAAAADAHGSEQVVSRAARKKADHEEVARILEDEGVADEEEGKQADELEKLVFNPHSEDALLYAVPMCAPYGALKDYKYKAKLTPGSLKKGKACKTVIELFSRSRLCLPAEAQLMKALTDTEMVAVAIGDVKINIPGLQEAKRQIKSGKQQKKGTYAR